MLGCIINVTQLVCSLFEFTASLSHWKTFKIPQCALMNSAPLSSSNTLPPGQHMLISLYMINLYCEGGKDKTGKEGGG